MELLFFAKCMHRIKCRNYNWKKQLIDIWSIDANECSIIDILGFGSRYRMSMIDYVHFFRVMYVTSFIDAYMDSL